MPFPSGERVLPGFMARPARVRQPLPAILVIQEVWGVDDHIQDLTLRLATAGYVAFAPDLYAEGGQRPETLAVGRVEGVKRFLDTLPPGAWGNPAERDAALARLPEPERTHVGGTLGTLFGGVMRDIPGFTRHLRAAADFLRGHEASRGRPVGSTGYCMGGALSALLACADPKLAAAVIYYGAAPPAAQIPGIGCPLLGFYGGDDLRITEAVPALAQTLQAAGKRFEYHVYPGAPHAFFNDTRASYHVDAARDAWARTLAFFAQALGGTA